MPGTATITADFRDEYQAEQTMRLRRRFLWYSGVIVALNGLLMLVGVLALGVALVIREVPGPAVLGATISISGALLAWALYLGAFLHVRRHSPDRESILRIVFWLIVISGALSILSDVVNTEIGARAVLKGGDGSVRWSIGSGRGFTATHGLVTITFTHLFASLFLPWTPRESIRPVIPLLALNTVIALAYIGHSWVTSVIAIFASPLVFVPGVLVCAWRTSRFRERFHYRMLRGRYGELKQELVDARRIHEALFPPPITDGPLRVEYRYEPMRQIGGDYLFTRLVKPENKPFPILNLVLIDVTGHGVSAALTVNRLTGEIEREYGVDPMRAPGRLLHGLNEYIHHALAIHSVYATALCVRIDPNEDTLEWASAGHPPAFLRAVDGTIHQLDSTTFVLGAAHGDDFVANPQTMRFGKGDTLLAYTDGATEARNEDGRMLRTEGILRVLASGRPDPEGGWAESVLRAVNRHRAGPTQDDTLLVEVYRPVDFGR